MLGYNDIFWISAIGLALASAVAYFRRSLRKKRLEAARKLTAADVMVPLKDMQTFQHGQTGLSALTTVLRSFQPYFPVSHRTEVIGLIDRDTIIKAAALGENGYLSGFMDREFLTVSPETRVVELMTLFEAGAEAVVVLNEEELVGMITKEQLVQLLTIRAVTVNNPHSHQGVFDEEM